MDFDLVVIGAGPGGFKAATAAARLGARVALVERAREGGTCMNEGCIPSAALLRPAALLEEVRAAAGRGLTGALAADFAAAVRHKDAVVASLAEAIPHLLKRLGVQSFRGAARLEAPDRVRVNNDLLRAKRIVIATGSRPRELAEWPTDGEAVISSHEFYTRVSRLPRRLLVIGGGALGVEAAYVAAQFGAEVTLAERESRLLPDARVPEHAADLLEAKLERLGVRVRTGAPDLFAQAGDYDMVLVAAGRVPNSEELGLEAIGVRTSVRGQIVTDEYLETDARGVYAIGDVRAGPMTANAALYDAKVVVANALGGERTRANYFKVPFVVRSALEIATVGLSEAQAEAAGFTPRVARSGFASSGKARARHDTEGFIEVVHDLETGQLLGGCVVGPEAGEQILLLGAACQSSRGLWLFRDLCFSHPSWCEGIETAVEPHAAALARSAATLFRPGIHAQR